MRATINDIARKAGVSKTTVSFAFNNPAKISKETFTRIMEIASELGYVPDPVARTLARKRTGSIGLLLPQSIQEVFQNPHIPEILRGIGLVCDREGLSLGVLSPFKGVLAQTVRNAAVDGIITLGIGSGMSVLDLFHQRGLPFVTIDGGADGNLVNVGIDDGMAAERLMDAVLAQGHRRIAIFTLKEADFPDTGDHFSATNDARLAGFARSLARYGLSMGDSGPVRSLHTGVSPASGRDAAKQILSGANRPTAIVCLSDAQALGVYEACKGEGCAIPGDVSVVGFDGIPFGAFMDPPLATLSQPGFEKGEAAANLLVDMIRKKPAASICLGTEVVLRQSLGPARRGA